MADNERVQWNLLDTYYGQHAPSQENRTEWYPGKATSREGDLNWERDYRWPQGTPAFDEANQGSVRMRRVRVVKLHRNIVCDNVLWNNGLPIAPEGQFPITEAPVTTTITDPSVWGTVQPEHEFTPAGGENENKEFEEYYRELVDFERPTGYDWIDEPE